jgi:hypothetical protein
MILFSRNHRLKEHKDLARSVVFASSNEPGLIDALFISLRFSRDGPHFVNNARGPCPELPCERENVGITRLTGPYDGLINFSMALVDTLETSSTFSISDMSLSPMFKIPVASCRSS